VSVEIAKVRNSLRERKVPEFVIDKQQNKFVFPSSEEGIDDIRVIIN
jgi:predicted kinase